jgi:hypothetical protein
MVEKHKDFKLFIKGGNLKHYDTNTLVSERDKNIMKMYFYEQSPSENQTGLPQSQSEGNI